MPVNDDFLVGTWGMHNNNLPAMDRFVAGCTKYLPKIFVYDISGLCTVLVSMIEEQSKHFFSAG